MKLNLTREELDNLVIKQLNNFFLELDDVEKDKLIKSIDICLDRCDKCFENINNKYFFNDGGTIFNYTHSGQYTIFLYYLANSVYKLYNDESLAGKVYYLNKIMNGVEIFYQVELPNSFYVEHPIGTALGRAKYGENFVVYQNCTVGNSLGKNPVIGKNVTLYAGACILGDTIIGDESIISANTFIINEVIPRNSIVFGNSPNLIIKENFIKHKLFER